MHNRNDLMCDYCETNIAKTKALAFGSRVKLESEKAVVLLSLIQCQHLYRRCQGRAAGIDLHLIHTNILKNSMDFP